MRARQGTTRCRVVRAADGRCGARVADRDREQPQHTTVDFDADDEQEREQLRVDLIDAVRRGDRGTARTLSNRIVGEDATDLLDGLSEQELARFFTILGEDELGDLIAELDPRDAARILSRMSNAQVADLLEAIDPDDATDIVEEIEPEAQEAIFVEMEPAEASEIRTLLAYPPIRLAAS